MLPLPQPPKPDIGSPLARARRWWIEQRHRVAAARRQRAMDRSRGDQPRVLEGLGLERCVRNVAELGGAAAVDAAAWSVSHALGLLVLGAALILAAHVWAP
jgi:hypothetical protein